jgi:5S rRNA maturation endonuclease (ribonuclease M5)
VTGRRPIRAGHFGPGQSFETGSGQSFETAQPAQGIPEDLASAFAPVGDEEPVVLMDELDDKDQIQPSDAGPSDSFLRGSKYGRVPDHQWHYRDRTNRVVLTVCRFETPQGKSILQCTPWAQADGNVAFKWRGLPAERPLYDLPALLDSVNSPVLVVEGERCVDAARQLAPQNWLITTWSGGANAVSKTSWSVLQNREVHIWADADEAGRKSAKAIEALLPYATTYGDHAFAAIRKTKGSLPSGWDAADAVDGGLTAEDFAKLFATPASNLMHLMDAADMPTLYPNEARPIIEGLLREGESLNIVGSSKSRKSWASLHLAMSVAMGRDWLGFPCHRGRVVLIDNELALGSLSKRISTVACAMGITTEDLRGRLTVVSLRGQLRGLDDLCKELMTWEVGKHDLIG